MNKKDKSARVLLIFALVIGVTLFRFFPYTFESMSGFNFAPIGAIALFGSAYLGRKAFAFALPLVALWISNLVINNVFVPEYFDGFVLFGSWEMYLPFLLIVVLGIVVLKKVTPLRLFGASLGASVLFFIVSNFFVWTSGGLYPLSVQGLGACYVAAVPFFWNTLASDLFFVSVLFGAFELYRQWQPKFAMQEQ